MMLKKTLLIVLQSILASVVFAGNIYTGPAGGYWNDPANWWPTQTLPGSSEQVFINPTTGGFPDVNSVVPDIGWLDIAHAEGFVSGLDIVSGGSLTALYRIWLGSVDSTNPAGGITGILNVNGGTLTTGPSPFGAIDVGHGKYTTGILNLTDGSINCEPALTVSANPGANGFVNVSGGTLNVNGELRIGYSGPRGEAEFNMSGGTVNVQGFTMLGWDFPRTGVLNISGGSFNANGGLHCGIDGFGEVYLSGGTLYCYSLTFNWGSLGSSTFLGNGFIDISESGTLIYEGDMGSAAAIWENVGMLKAYGGQSSLIVDYDNINPGKTTLTAYKPEVYAEAQAGWKIFDNDEFPNDTGIGYHYGPCFVVEGGNIHAWFTAPGSPQWDEIDYRLSTDGGHTWTADVTACSGQNPPNDHVGGCADPSVIKIGSYYYLAYGSNAYADEGNPNNHTDMYVARSTTPAGPFTQKWNGSGWGQNPVPIVDYDSYKPVYGVGEPSMVVKDGTIYLYYTYVGTDPEKPNPQDPNNIVSQIRLKTADASNPNWPATLTDPVNKVILNTEGNHDRISAKYIPELDRFIMMHHLRRLSEENYIQMYESPDGYTFYRTFRLDDNVAWFGHNSGLSGNGSGHIDPDDDNFIAYAYDEDGLYQWGDWETYLSPITLQRWTPSEFDANGDGYVNYKDFADFSNQWGN